MSKAKGSASASSGSHYEVPEEWVFKPEVPEVKPEAKTPKGKPAVKTEVKTELQATTETKSEVKREQVVQMRFLIYTSSWDVSFASMCE